MLRILFAAIFFWSVRIAAYMLFSAILLRVVLAASEYGTPDRTDTIAQLYASRCASCHGKDLDGGQGPSLLNHIWLHGSDDDSIAQTIRSGVRGSEMPAWRGVLSEGEIRGLVIYIHERQSGPARTRSDVSIPGGLLHSQLYDFRVQTVLDHGLSDPWSMAVLPDGRALVTEHAQARLLIAERDHDEQPKSIIGTPRDCWRMFDVALHPEHRRNGWVYLSCTGFSPPSSHSILLVRGRIRNNTWVNSEVLLNIPGMSLTGRIAFDRERHVYLTSGTGSLSEGRVVTYEAQDLSRGEGKIFRVNDDGYVPRTNPFVKTPGALGPIWTLGHRIPQGLAFDPHTQTLWSTEHGPRGGDELNLIVGGHNYGWPLVTYGVDYTGKPITSFTKRAGMTDPILHWDVDIGISGIDFYEGSEFPKWKYNLFVGSLRERALFRFVIDGRRVVHRERILDDIGRIRHVSHGPNGELYLILSTPGNTGGACIVRLIREK